MGVPPNHQHPWMREPEGDEPWDDPDDPRIAQAEYEREFGHDEDALRRMEREYEKYIDPGGD